MSLLCQLWTLNESIQEFKQIVRENDRHSETNSDCSFSHENGLDTISDHDEEEYEYEYSKGSEEDIYGHEDSGYSGSISSGSTGSSCRGMRWKQTKC